MIQHRAVGQRASESVVALFAMALAIGPVLFADPVLGAEAVQIHTVGALTLQGTMPAAGDTPGAKEWLRSGLAGQGGRSAD